MGLVLRPCKSGLAGLLMLADSGERGGYHAKGWRNLGLTRDFFFSSRRRHTRFKCDCSSDVCSSDRSEEHTSELQSHLNLVCRLMLGVQTGALPIDRKSTRLNPSPT